MKRSFITIAAVGSASRFARFGATQRVDALRAPPSRRVDRLSLARDTVGRPVWGEAPGRHTVFRVCWDGSEPGRRLGPMRLELFIKHQHAPLAIR
jgi:hypothetical protein